jgi:hypothetical protein
MSEPKDWTLDECISWLKHPYNQPCKTDDSFDRAYRGSVKRRLRELQNEKEYKPITQAQINLINDNFKGLDRVEHYDRLFGREIITPRYYLERDEKNMPKMHYDAWYKMAKCRCDCGAEVSLAYHSHHKKTKKHKENLKSAQHKY